MQTPFAPQIHVTLAHAEAIQAVHWPLAPHQDSWSALYHGAFHVDVASQMCTHAFSHTWHSSEAACNCKAPKKLYNSVSKCNILNSMAIYIIFYFSKIIKTEKNNFNPSNIGSVWMNRADIFWLKISIFPWIETDTSPFYQLGNFSGVLTL